MTYILCRLHGSDPATRATSYRSYRSCRSGMYLPCLVDVDVNRSMKWKPMICLVGALLRPSPKGSYLSRVWTCATSTVVSLFHFLFLRFSFVVSFSLSRIVARAETTWMPMGLDAWMLGFWLGFWDAFSWCLDARSKQRARLLGRVPFVFLVSFLILCPIEFFFCAPRVLVLLW